MGIFLLIKKPNPQKVRAANPDKKCMRKLKQVSSEAHNIKTIGLQEWIFSGKEAVWRLGPKG